ARSRAPSRRRVPAAFAVVMALGLAASGRFLYSRLSSHLSTQLEQELQVRAQDLSALVRHPGAALASDAGGRPGGALASDRRSRLAEDGESYAQLVDGGWVVDATPPLGGSPVLSNQQLRV